MPYQPRNPPDLMNCAWYFPRSAQCRSSASSSAAAAAESTGIVRALRLGLGVTRSSLTSMSRKRARYSSTLRARVPLRVGGTSRRVLAIMRILNIYLISTVSKHCAYNLERASSGLRRDLPDYRRLAPYCID